MSALTSKSMLNQHIVGAEAEAISWQLLQQSSASWPLEEGRGKERKIESERKQINKEGERGGGERESWDEGKGSVSVSVTFKPV